MERLAGPQISPVLDFLLYAFLQPDGNDRMRLLAFTRWDLWSAAQGGHYQQQRSYFWRVWWSEKWDCRRLFVYKSYLPFADSIKDMNAVCLSVSQALFHNNIPKWHDYNYILLLKPALFPHIHQWLKLKSKSFPHNKPVELPAML